MSRALLDSNVLLALLDSDHVDHERVTFDRSVALSAVPAATPDNLTIL